MLSQKKLGKSNITVSSIGFGGAEIGDLYENLKDDLCNEILKSSYQSGINLYDTSPFYGYGLSETRLGNYLSSVDRNNFILSTKVGRYLTPENPNKIERGIWKGGLNYVPNFDYTYDGVMKSFDQSLSRLKLSKIDVCLIHDVDTWTHGEEMEKNFKIAMEGAYVALSELKSQKVISAIGVGVNETEMCTRFAKAGDFDCMILAGRYTLLEQGGLNDFFPLAIEKNIGVILAGVFNSGILAKGVSPNSTYDYAKIPDHVAEKYFKIEKVCKEFNVPVAAAALQFCNANEAVSTMILGMDRVEQINQNINLLNFKIDSEFWVELKKNKLIDSLSTTP